MSHRLIDEYLEKQQQFSAVEKFALQYDFHQLSANQQIYEDLIPKNTPSEGEQYAFSVDLDKCTGCKACVSACHHENGLDEDESWRSVGLVYGGTAAEPAVQHVTTACHHCLDPACLNGCPVNAYEKSPITGIVKHLDDQCIGCQYCTLTCPYDVPKYSKKKGIVHKCDMCIGRLEAGQAPACVRACPSGAIRITTVKVDQVQKNPDDFVAISNAPSSRLTQPTTRYLSQKKEPPHMVSADFYSVKPAHSHTPLIFMLTLTQLSVGAFVVIFMLNHYLDQNFKNYLMPYYVLIAFLAGALALGVSVLHLGRPFYAFRAVIGIKKSWLSREIVMFGVFASLAMCYALMYWIGPVKDLLNNFLGEQFLTGRFSNILLSATTVFGLLGVYCSVMVYQKTKRPFWDHPMTFMKFFLTTAILGIVTIVLASVIFIQMVPNGNTDLFMSTLTRMSLWGIIVLTLIKLVIESTILFNLFDRDMTFFKKTAYLMIYPLRKITIGRYVSSLLGAVCFPAIILFQDHPLSRGWIVTLYGAIFLLSLTAEFLERYLFFRTVVPFKMPGRSGV